MHPPQISTEKSLMWALDFVKWCILGCGIYFCWISGLISMEQHMQCRLDPHPTSSSQCCTIRKHILPSIVAFEWNVLYICKCSLKFHLIIISWRFYWWAAEATNQWRICKLTICGSPWILLPQISLWILWWLQTLGSDFSHSLLLPGLSLAAESLAPAQPPLC